MHTLPPMQEHRFQLQVEQRLTSQYEHLCMNHGDLSSPENSHWGIEKKNIRFPVHSWNKTPQTSKWFWCFIIVWQRYWPDVRSGQCPSVSVPCSSCPPNYTDRNVTSELSNCIWFGWVLLLCPPYSFFPWRPLLNLGGCPKIATVLMYDAYAAASCIWLLVSSDCWSCHPDCDSSIPTKGTQ